MLADTMEAHNNPEVAELFRKLARIEQLHADKIVEHKRMSRPQQAIPEGKARWDEGEGHETADPAELHYRMQPYHALQMALAGEQRAQRFFEGGSAANCPRRLRWKWRPTKSHVR
jgi:rubrerythrin